MNFNGLSTKADQNSQTSQKETVKKPHNRQEMSILTLETRGNKLSRLERIKAAIADTAINNVAKEIFYPREAAENGSKKTREIKWARTEEDLPNIKKVRRANKEALKGIIDELNLRPTKDPVGQLQACNKIYRYIAGKNNYSVASFAESSLYSKEEKPERLLYNAAVRNACVCSGNAIEMEELLQKLDIPAKVIIFKDKNSTSWHAITSVKIGGEKGTELFYDPTSAGSESKNYFTDPDNQQYQKRVTDRFAAMTAHQYFGSLDRIEGIRYSKLTKDKGIRHKKYELKMNGCNLNKRLIRFLSGAEQQYDSEKINNNIKSYNTQLKQQERQANQLEQQNYELRQQKLAHPNRHIVDLNRSLEPTADKPKGNSASGHEWACGPDDLIYIDYINGSNEQRLDDIVDKLQLTASNDAVTQYQNILRAQQYVEQNIKYTPMTNAEAALYPDEEYSQRRLYNSLHGRGAQFDYVNLMQQLLGRVGVKTDCVRITENDHDKYLLMYDSNNTPLFFNPADDRLQAERYQGRTADRKHLDNVPMLGSGLAYHNVVKDMDAYQSAVIISPSGSGRPVRQVKFSHRYYYGPGIEKYGMDVPEAFTTYLLNSDETLTEDDLQATSGGKEGQIIDLAFERAAEYPVDSHELAERTALTSEYLKDSKIRDRLNRIIQKDKIAASDVKNVVDYMQTVSNLACGNQLDSSNTGDIGRLRNIFAEDDPLPMSPDDAPEAIQNMLGAMRGLPPNERAAMSYHVLGQLQMAEHGNGYTQYLFSQLFGGRLPEQDEISQLINDGYAYDALAGDAMSRSEHNDFNSHSRMVSDLAGSYAVLKTLNDNGCQSVEVADDRPLTPVFTGEATAIDNETKNRVRNILEMNDSGLVGFSYPAALSYLTKLYVKDDGIHLPKYAKHGGRLMFKPDKDDDINVEFRSKEAAESFCQLYEVIRQAGIEATIGCFRHPDRYPVMVDSQEKSLKDVIMQQNL